MMRIFLKVLNQKDKNYDKLLEVSGFGYYFASLTQKQYALLQMYIRTKTENIHVISRYVEESNIRLRLFESILKCTSEKLKTELLNSLLINKIVSTLLVSETEFDVAYGKTPYKFLPFRQFQPFRNEAIV